MSNANFIDFIKINCRSGNGGSGSSHFRREKFVPLGGPDGGDGGKGGDIILKGNSQLWTLLHLRYTKHLIAENGGNGSGSKKHGRDGKDIIINVPLGTVAKSVDDNNIILEIIKEGEEKILLKGGQGGLGNFHFKSSTNQAPKKTTKGEQSDSREIFLEMRLIADIGLLGLPNAGKSTLINALTNSKSKVGNFPFTTLIPTLGVLENSEKSLTIADMPGIIEGASDGHGLGFKFLRHLHRTKFLLHLVDCSISADEALDSFSIIENELKEFHLDFST